MSIKEAKKWGGWSWSKFLYIKFFYNDWCI